MKKKDNINSFGGISTMHYVPFFKYLQNSVNRFIIAAILFFFLVPAAGAGDSQDHIKGEIAANIWFRPNGKSMRNYYKNVLDSFICKYKNTNGSSKIMIYGSFNADISIEFRTAQMDTVFNYLVKNGIPFWKIDTYLKTGGTFDEGRPYNIIKTYFIEAEK